MTAHKTKPNIQNRAFTLIESIGFSTAPCTQAEAANAAPKMKKLYINSLKLANYFCLFLRLKKTIDATKNIKKIPTIASK